MDKWPQRRFVELIAIRHVASPAPRQRSNGAMLGPTTCQIGIWTAAFFLKPLRPLVFTHCRLQGLPFVTAMGLGFPARGILCFFSHALAFLGEPCRLSGCFGLGIGLLAVSPGFLFRLLLRLNPLLAFILLFFVAGFLLFLFPRFAGKTFGPEPRFLGLGLGGASLSIFLCPYGCQPVRFGFPGFVLCLALGCLRLALLLLCQSCCFQRLAFFLSPALGFFLDLPALGFGLLLGIRFVTLVEFATEFCQRFRSEERRVGKECRL